MDHIMNVFNRLQSQIQARRATSLPSVNLALPQVEKLNDSVYQVCKPRENPSIEIVFFHGLNLDGSEEVYLSTWMSADGSQLWPEWIVQGDPQARILLASYDASVRRTDQTGLMDDYVICENLVQDLTDAEVGKEGCPVILVGHSIGCLVMKELCVMLAGTLNQLSSPTLNKSAQNLFNSIKGLFYYSCPHQGSELADSSTEVSKAPMFEDLTTLNAVAARKNENFRKLRKKYEWLTYGIGESRRTTFGNFTGFIVPEGSVRYDADGHYTADADHFNVCRPHSTKSSTYRHLSTFITNVLTKDKERHCPKIHIPDGMVGLERQVQVLMEKLEGVKRLGIVGMGGIGKTTLAKALYQSIASSYEYCCFLTDVKTFMTSKDDLDNLRNKITEKLSHKGREVNRSFKWDMMNGKEVLIVLDDVEYISQIQVMILSDGFSPKSRLIVTSRDKGFLEGEEDFTCYQVKPLDDAESRKLFCLNAFKTEDVLNDYRDRVMRFVQKCEGLPLALRVMGKYLKGKREEQLWNAVLQKLKNAQPPNGKREDELWSLLQLSYDSLQEQEQQMFLDVAVCFHGEDMDTVQRAWKVCSWASPLGLQNLVDNCLVTIEKQYSWVGIKSCIRMHEVLRTLGRRIAGHSRMCFDRSNRLPTTWPAGMKKEEAEVKVLKIVGTVLDTLQGDTIQEIHELQELEILWLDGVFLQGPLPPRLVDLRISGQFRSLSSQDECWQSRFPRPSSEHSRQRPALRNLEISSLFVSKEVLDTVRERPALEYLKLNLHSDTCSADSLDILGHLQGLEHLQISGLCLEAPPSTLGNLRALKHLVIMPCKNWKVLLSILGQLQSLQKFVLRRCDEHGSPSSVDQLEFLQSLSRTGVVEGVGQLDLGVFHERNIRITSYNSEFLPNSLGRLGQAHAFILSDCKSLRALPDTLGDLQSLRSLHLISCESLKSVPDSVGRLRALEDFRIEDSNGLKAIPDTLGDLQSLRVFYLESCESLTYLPASLGQLRALQDIRVESCKGLVTLPDTLGDLQALNILYLISCESLKSVPDSVGRLRALEDFRIKDCKGLRALPENFGCLRGLKIFAIQSCESLESLPNTLGNLQGLQNVYLTSCDSLESLPDSFGQLQALKELRIENCKSLVGLSDTMGNLQALEIFYLRSCESLKSLPDSVGRLRALRDFRIEHCDGLRALPETFGGLQSLEIFTIESCQTLNSLPKTLGYLQSLESLMIRDCHSLQVLPDTLGELRALKTFLVKECRGLRALPHTLGDLQALEIFNLISCEALTSLPDSIGRLQALKDFGIEHCEGLRALPDTLGCLQCLEIFIIQSCESLESLPDTLGDLAALEKFIIESCKSLQSIPDTLGDLLALEIFYLRSCESLKFLPDSLGGLQALKILVIESCQTLNFLPKTLGNLRSLECLMICDCHSLEILPNALADLRALKKLIIRQCRGLRALPHNLEDLQALETFYLVSCESLKFLPDSVGWLRALKDFRIEHCKLLFAFPDSIGDLQSLQIFVISNCESLISLPGTIGNLQALECIEIFNCRDLTALPDTIGNLRALEYLRLYSCQSLEILPHTVGMLPALQLIQIEHCNGLRVLPDTLGELRSLRIFYIKGCRGLRALPDSLGALQSLQFFIIESCEDLKSLPGTIGNLQALECLDIHDCQSLEALPDSLSREVIRALRVFMITSCKHLKSHPEDGALLQAMDKLEKKLIRRNTAPRKWGSGLRILKRILPERAS